MAQEPERDLNGLPREKLAEVLDSFRATPTCSMLSPAVEV